MSIKAYLGIKYHEDHRNKDEIDALSAVLKDKGIETTCIARDVEKWGEVQLSAQALMKRAFKEIDQAEIIILEMTEKGIGLGIEAGYASARGKPLIVITKDASTLSATMRGIADTIIQYSQPLEINLSVGVKALNN